MNPRPATGRSALRGFTLLELLVVLTLLGLILALAAPRVGVGLPAVSARAAAADVVAALQSARSRALTEQRTVAVVVDSEARSVTVEKERRVLRSGAEVRVVGAREAQSRLSFYPDGSSSGGELQVGHTTHRFRIDLDWLTGRVQVSRGTEDG